jgi:predicted CopG family antitoxin
MKKTIDLSNEDMEKVRAYKERKGLKSFSETVREMIREADFISISIVPESAGEVNR